MANLSKWFPFKFDRKKDSASETKEKAGAPLTAKQPLDPFQQMSQLMRNMFRDDWFTPGLRSFTQQPSWFGDFSPTLFTPSVDVVDEKSTLVVSAELPGLGKDDVKLMVDHGVLTITGEKKHEFEEDEDGCFRTERYFGSFHRAIPLPVDVQLDGAEANFDKGVLTVKFPKSDKATPSGREIPLS